MSKQKNEGFLENQNDPEYDSKGGNNSGSDPVLAANCSGHLTVEEHRKNLNIDAPVFAAVMQSKSWRSGKKVPEAEFKNAVEGFLNSSMGGN